MFGSSAFTLFDIYPLSKKVGSKFFEYAGTVVT